MSFAYSFSSLTAAGKTLLKVLSEELHCPEPQFPAVKENNS